jgi:hypothetical protein
MNDNSSSDCTQVKDSSQRKTKKKENIFRSKHDKENPYVMISKEVIRDIDISPLARFLLIFVLSYPNTWKTHPKNLAKETGIGRDKVYSLIDELIIFGHCVKVEYQTGNLNSEIHYEFYENPAHNDYSRRPEFQDVENISLTTRDNPAHNDYSRRPEFQDPENQYTSKEEDDRKEIYIKKDNVTEMDQTTDLKEENLSFDRSSYAQDFIVSFEPFSYVLPNGQKLSDRCARSFSKYQGQDRAKLLANIEYFEKQCSKKMPENPEAYLQGCIKHNYAGKETLKWQNRMYAQVMKETHNLFSVKILKTVVHIRKNSDSPVESINLDLPLETFSEIIDREVDRK